MTYLPIKFLSVHIENCRFMSNSQKENIINRKCEISLNCKGNIRKIQYVGIPYAGSMLR